MGRAKRKELKGKKAAEKKPFPKKIITIRGSFLLRSLICGKGTPPESGTAFGPRATLATLGTGAKPKESFEGGRVASGLEMGERKEEDLSRCLPHLRNSPSSQI